MSNISSQVVIEQLLNVLEEAVTSPEKPWSYFIDNRANGGLLGSLAEISAGDASRPVAGTSMAAQVFHVIFALSASAAWIRGDSSPRNWEESWRKSSVDDQAWQGMLLELQSAYKDLHQAIQTHATSTPEALGGAIGVIAHVA
ncbi:MAG: hypothetical protein AB7P49_20895, partial [Bdellovibrionales bacterium]